MLMVALLVAAPAHADPLAVHPPYDVGCLYGPGYGPYGFYTGCIPFDPARQGTIFETPVPGVQILYGPPFVFPAVWSAGSTTGIYVDVPPGATTIDASASIIGGPAAVHGGLIGPVACFALASPDGVVRASGGCASLLTMKAITPVYSFGVGPGRYTLLVFLAGLTPMTATVESISYTVH
jgi:hypothetical protein